MKKILLAVGLSTFLMTGLLQAEDTQKAVAKADGVYLGVGGGVTFNVAYLYTGYYQDDTSVYNDGSLSDSSAGYIIYGGYQFNKIIGVEVAYTDYGSFSDTLTRSGINPTTTTFTSDPTSFSVYANAGYTFANGLRPFGQLGLGYVIVNGSGTTNGLNIDDGVSMRFGLGLEYAAPALAGFGFRVAYIDELQMDASYTSYDNGDKSTLFMNVNGMLYVGAQYKF